MDSISEAANASGDLKRTRRRRAAYCDPRIDRMPPHSHESEQGVLGCILLSPTESLDHCRSKLKSGAEEFYDLRHQTIYREMLFCFEELSGLDQIILAERLKRVQLLDEIGGTQYLFELERAVWSAANIPYWLDIIHEKFILRKTIQTCSDVVGKIYDSTDDADTILDEVERDILAIRSFNSADAEHGIKEIVDGAIASIEKTIASKGEVSGLSTGFPDLDVQTDGLHGGDMIVIAAYPSVGKTSLAMNIVEHVLLHQHKPVGVFSLEMTSVQLVRRFLCSHAKVNLRNLRDGFLNEADFPKLVSSAGKLSNSAIYFDDGSDLSIYALRAKARRMKQKYDIKMIVVDYLQLLNASGGSRRVENRQQEVADISNGIKSMAKELDIPVLALSQLNDDGQLRESRAIGHDADGLWKLQRQKKPADAGEVDDSESEAVDLWIRKNRNGPRDKCVHLTFLKSFTRFESAAKISENDLPM